MRYLLTDELWTIMGPLVERAAGGTVEVAFVDRGYGGAEAAEQAQTNGIQLEVVKHSEAKRGLVLLRL